MQKILLVQVGKAKDAYLKEGIQEFEKRLKKFIQFETVTISEGDFSSNDRIESERKKESEKILQALPKGGMVVYLDVRGKEYTSETFAELLGRQKDEGVHMVFLIGGAYGIDEEILGSSIQKRLSLSKMTMTHQMVRLVFLEQLYRGYSILAGSEYHH